MGLGVERNFGLPLPRLAVVGGANFGPKFTALIKFRDDIGFFFKDFVIIGFLYGFRVGTLGGIVAITTGVDPFELSEREISDDFGDTDLLFIKDCDLIFATKPIFLTRLSSNSRLRSSLSSE